MMASLQHRFNFSLSNNIEYPEILCHVYSRRFVYTKFLLV